MPTFTYETTAKVMFCVVAETEADALLQARACIPLLAEAGFPCEHSDEALDEAAGTNKQEIRCYVDDAAENLELYERYNDTEPVQTAAELCPASRMEELEEERRDFNGDMLRDLWSIDHPEEAEELAKLKRMSRAEQNGVDPGYTSPDGN